MKVDIYGKYKVIYCYTGGEISQEDSTPGDIVFKDVEYDDVVEYKGYQLITKIAYLLSDPNVIYFSVKDNEIRIKHFNGFNGESCDYFMKIEEAKELYDNDDIYLVIPRKYDDIVNEHVEMFVEDDPQRGLVEEYLRDKEVGYRVCVLEIYTQVFRNPQKKCSRLDSITISNYMRSMKNWRLGRSSARFPEYGTQRYWEKIKDDKELEEL